jgi:hypothetical protein
VSGQVLSKEQSRPQTFTPPTLMQMSAGYGQSLFVVHALQRPSRFGTQAYRWKSICVQTSSSLQPVVHLRPHFFPWPGNEKQSPVSHWSSASQASPSALGWTLVGGAFPH